MVPASIAQIEESVVLTERDSGVVGTWSRKVDMRPPGKENSNSHGERPVQQIISMIKWFWTSGLSIKKSVCLLQVVPAYIAQIEVSVVLTEELNREGNKELNGSRQNG